MKNISLALFCTLCVLANVSEADVYKAIDENGNDTFTDVPLENAEKLEVGDRRAERPLHVTVINDAEVRSIVRDVGTISFNNNKPQTLTAFLHSLKWYLAEYEQINLIYKEEDIPYSEVGDYSNVTLAELMKDLDRKNKIKVVQLPGRILISRDW